MLCPFVSSCPINYNHKLQALVINSALGKESPKDQTSDEAAAENDTDTASASAAENNTDAASASDAGTDKDHTEETNVDADSATRRPDVKLRAPGAAM